MQLIGMLDSPYVRRVAVSLQLLGIGFEHRSISVFGGFEQFRGINPVVKAPTLVCGDGTVLMDSQLILDHAETVAPGSRRLMPASPAERLQMAACEKSVQIVYERQLRPAEKLHEPWLSRVTGQLLAAYGELEAELARRPLAVERGTIDQAGVSTAVAWRFTQAMQPGLIDAARHPKLQAFSDAAERLPEFLAAPHGDGTVARAG